MVGRRRKPNGAARPKPAASREKEAAAGAEASGTSAANGRREAGFDDPMRSVYMLAVLYAVTLEAAQSVRAFACAPTSGESTTDT